MKRQDVLIEEDVLNYGCQGKQKKGEIPDQKFLSPEVRALQLGFRQSAMSEKDRLLRTLFESPGKEHLNIKFCRGPSDDISPDDLCREANAAIFQVESGQVEPEPGFGDKERKVVDVKELFTQL